MALEVITREEAAKMMKEDGKRGIFCVYFARRRNKKEKGKVVAEAGDLRRMRCRYGVKKGLVGGQRGYTDDDKLLVTVYDMEAATRARDSRIKTDPTGDRRILNEDAHKAYRTVPIEGIKALTIGGVTYLVHDTKNIEAPLTKKEEEQLQRLLGEESTKMVEVQEEFAFEDYEEFGFEDWAED